MKYVILTISVILSFSCNTGRYEIEEPAWNLLNGPYVKQGEMMGYNGYWVEAYTDTITNSNRIILVNRQQHNFISDSLDIQPLTKDKVIDYGTVQFNEQEDRALVVIYKMDDSAFHTNIIKAWRANTNKGKFEPVSTTGIRVENIK